MDGSLATLLPGLSPELHAMLVIVVGIWAGTLGLPVPEEIPLLTAGVFASAGILTLPEALLASLLGCFSADLFVFTVGRQIGGGLRQHPYLRRILRGRTLLRARHLYLKKGRFTLFFARLLPGIKTPFLFTAGALHTPWSRFVARDLGSLAVLIPALVGIGYSSHWSMGRLSGVVRGVATVGTILFVTALLIALAVSVVNRRRFREWRRRCVEAGIPVRHRLGVTLPTFWALSVPHSAKTVSISSAGISPASTRQRGSKASPGKTPKSKSKARSAAEVRASRPLR